MSRMVYGVRIVEVGAAIVGVRHDEGARLGTVIERHPFDVAVVIERARALDDGEAFFVIDSEGLGGALFRLLADPDNDERMSLFSARGIERQALVDGLVVAVQDGSFHFAPGLSDQDSMNRALRAFRRQVGDDGIIGAELVVALTLALTSPPQPPEPFILFGTRR